MTQKKRNKGKVRVNILLDLELRDFAHDYAKRHHTTVTALFVNRLIELREKEKGIDVEQI